MHLSSSRPIGADSEPAPVNWDEVDQWCEENLFDIMCDVRGAPNPKKSNKREWRWGSQGSLILYRDHLNYVDTEGSSNGSAFRGVGYALGWPGAPWSNAETLRYVLEHMGESYRYDPIKRTEQKQKTKAEQKKRHVE